MPELPDIELYLHALRPRMVGQCITGVRVANPFLVRTTDPPVQTVIGRPIHGIRRVGKRIAFDADGLFMVLHLMVAGRLHWKAPSATIPGKVGLAALDVAAGTLVLTEAGSTRRASLHIAVGEDGLAAMDPGGLEPLTAELDAFCTRLTSERHTLKRALTDPTLFSGIGNAYSDEILHRARLSPLRLSDTLGPDESARLHAAVQATLSEWRDRLIAATGDAFPVRVSAFRPGMAVHGRYGKPCPVCETAVQRIRYASNEANYCPACQTGGRLLADRGLSRLLRSDWPRSLDEFERRKRGLRS